MAENIGHIIQIAGPAVDVQFTEAQAAFDLHRDSRGQRRLRHARAD